MRRLAAAAALAVTLAPAARGQDGPYRADLWTGLGSMAMQGANDERRHMFDGAMPAASSKDSALTWDSSRMGGGLAIGVEGSWLAADEWLVGGRAGFVSGGTALNSFTYSTEYAGSTAADTFSSRFAYKDSFSSSLIPLMAGGRYENHVASWLTVVTGAYAGFGIASGSVTFDQTIQAAGTGSFASRTRNLHVAYATSFGGVGFGGEVVTGLRFKLSPQVTLGCDLGYRLMMVKVKAASAVDLNGDGVLDGKPEYTLDFSGHLFAVTLGYAF